MSFNEASEPKKTALYEWHLQQGARMVDFAGYLMPLQYTPGILAEHKHTRSLVSLFDVSHMGIAEIKKIDHHEQALSDLTGISIEKLALNQLRYGLLLNEQGGIEDDLIIMNQPDRWLVVMNASRKKHDLSYLKRFLDVQEILNVSVIALQGPKSRSILASLFNDVAELNFMTSLQTIYNGHEICVSCSGYTGEDGFELIIPNEIIHDFIAQLCDFDDVSPAGLGARDSLRLEAGLCLYGHDMNDQITPIEASLTWAISPSYRTSGQGIAGKVIKQQCEQGIMKKRVGLKSEDKLIAREGAKIFNKNGQEIGFVTSGLPSPSLGVPIAMGYLNADQAADHEQVLINIRGNMCAFNICTMPFVSHQYKRKANS